MDRQKANAATRTQNLIPCVERLIVHCDLKNVDDGRPRPVNRSLPPSSFGICVEAETYVGLDRQSVVFP